MKTTLCAAAIIAGWIIPSAGMGAELLGRLFFTPAQRNVLDTGKDAGKPTRVAPVPQKVQLNGVVIRSDGGSTVWINGRETRGKAVSGVRASTSASDPTSAQLRVRGAKKPVRLRVGQRLDPVSGKVLESYESAVPSAANVVRSSKKPVAPSSKNLEQEDDPSAAVHPDQTSEVDADAPSNE